MLMGELMKVVKSALAGSLLLACAGCGYLFGDEGVFRDRAEDYKQAPEAPELRVPAGKNSEALKEIYVIPRIRDNLVPAGEFEVPRPTPLVAGAGSEVVRIQKLGSQSWALIGVAPGQVWPQVRSFLAASNMQVARADARAGIMDTNWLTLQGESLPSRFRFRMEQGVQRGTSELHVLQMNKGGSEENWPTSSDSPTQEADMLRSVSQFLADSAESAPVSMIAEQGLSAEGKISMQDTPDGATHIRLALPFDRAWASLGRALEQSTFEITDRDRSEGVFYTLYTGPEKRTESGWWARLWDSDEEDPMAGKSFRIIMQTETEQSVTIHLKPQDEAAEFTKRDEQNLLALIKGNIN